MGTHALDIPDQPNTVDLSLEGRYSTIWPVLVTRTAWHWSGDAILALTMGRARWAQLTTAIVLGGIAAVFMWAAWLLLMILIPLWPFGFMAFLPTRIAVRRDVTQKNMIYTLCWVSLFLFTCPCWAIALVLAFRDPKPATPTTAWPNQNRGW
jgi:hypothetical protein